MRPDVVVIGAGISGLVMAERFSTVLKRDVLVLEQRDHIGGNCYDYQDESGIYVHQYGPHLFHTSKQKVWEYLSQFTSWHKYEHKVLSSVDGKLVPLPFNLNTLHELYEYDNAKRIEDELLLTYGEGAKVSILELRESENPLINGLAELVYSKFFVNYTAKQWGCDPEDISKDVIGRVPVVLSRDDRYFHDTYQAIPAEGYTAMFRKIAESSRINIEYGIDATTRLNLLDDGNILFNGEPFRGAVVFTGQLDALFDYCEGELAYRSLQFELEEHDIRRFQPATTVNYPNDEEFTRITEFKHILPADVPTTVTVKEFPQDYDRRDPSKNIPYYPMFTKENLEAFSRYEALAGQFPTLIHVGRLAQYRYFNMDDAVDNALSTFEKWVYSQQKDHHGFER